MDGEVVVAGVVVVVAVVEGMTVEMKNDLGCGTEEASRRPKKGSTLEALSGRDGVFFFPFLERVTPSSRSASIPSMMGENASCYFCLTQAQASRCDASSLFQSNADFL